MKYKNSKIVDAKYDTQEGNPFLESLPEELTKNEFIEQIESKLLFSPDVRKLNSKIRRRDIMQLTTWFYPMDYMYVLYDMLYRSIISSYQTKKNIESIRNINSIYMDFRTGTESVLHYSTQAYSSAILGVPGIGKSSTIQRCLNTIPQVIIHKEYDGKMFYTKQINYLFVECPSDCSIRTLVYNVLLAIDQAIGTSYLEQNKSTKYASSSALTAKLKIICINHHIGLIVLDEIQNAVYTATQNKQVKPLIKFLVELTNETTTSICLCGTLDAEELFLKQEHLKRRTRGLRLYPMKYGEKYREFITELWQYQFTKKYIELDEKLTQQLYDLSGGIPAYIIKIFQEAQIQAIFSGRERLEYESFKNAISTLAIKVPKYYGQQGTSISDFEVFDYQEDINNESFVYKNIQENNTELKKPQKRYYATPRGRKAVERSKADLIYLWKKNREKILSLLETYEMVERRFF